MQNRPPYQRPPLSKKYQLGEMALERLFLKPEAFYGENDIDLRSGSHVTQVVAASKSVQIGEDVLSYDQLVFTTGSSPRYLPAAVGGTLEGVHVVSSLSDVDAMANEFTAESHVSIIGGSGASARKRSTDISTPKRHGSGALVVPAFAPQEPVSSPCPQTPEVEF